MARTSRELPKDRLATTDERGRRVYLYPADVRGLFRRWRNLSQVILIAIFLLIPWVRIGGEPLLLLDVARRRFTLFGTTFWGHEAPLLIFLLLSAALTLFLITAVFGRVWCGWACPQTVFIDGIYRRVERLLEGDSVTRKRRDQAPLTAGTFGLKSLKWGIFLLLSAFIGNCFLAYFVGTDELLRMMSRPPTDNWGAFLVMAGVTGLTLFDFGWFREQFCVIACPYGRLQSVLLDNRSAVVAYDLRRGEPRRGQAPKGATEGDCIDCFRCVQVCPTGIDIRRGVQLECIHCTSCIDACDEVMDRTGGKPGLIRYATSLLSRGEDPTPTGTPFRPAMSARAWIYSIALGVVLVGLVTTLARRDAFEFALTRAIESPYQLLPGDRVSNHFKVDLRNLSSRPARVELRLGEALQESGARLVFVNAPAELPAGKSHRSDLFVEFPRGILTRGRGMLELWSSAQTQDGSLLLPEQRILAPLVGPY